MTGNASLTTAQLADAVRGITYAALPDDVRFLARQCVLDWLGVTLAGADEPLTAILREEALSDGGREVATLLGSGERVTPRQAALVNGAASHALDFDDVHTGMSGHPSVPLLPAILALAEEMDASGQDVISAFVAGFEAECLLGAAVNPGHYAAGFHATGTLGTFGAAAACAHLLRLDSDRWLHALGIAAAQAAGLKSLFGTMCKPFHAGKAAENGLMAAKLAAKGFTSNPEAIETLQGFAATHHSSGRPVTLTGDFAIRDVLFKYHAACYGTHAGIEAILRLREQNRVAPDDVVAIHLEVPAANMAMCNIAEPVTPLEGKFSMRFTAALALVEGVASEQAFTERAVADPRLTAVRDRVTITPNDAQGIGAATKAVLRLHDGRTLVETVDMSIPATDLEGQWEKLSAKFQSLAGPVLGRNGADELYAAIVDLDRLASARRLTELTVPALAPSR